MCAAALLLAATAGRALPPEAPARTTISDVLYRADGTPASGTLLISWPAFVTADHVAVAAGSTSVAIGPGGAVNLALVPNEGADPAGTYYRVVLKLSDGSSNVEFWSVPAASPAGLEAIRATVAPAGVALQAASRTYVDAAVAGKANDLAVLHNSGDESVAGVKQFAVSPLVPAPSVDQGAANKAYVDSIAAVPPGLYVLKAGDTLNGPLTLSADPVAPGQAANRHYVDTQIAVVSGALAGKADIGHTQEAATITGAFPSLTARNANGRRFASQFAGANAGERMQAAIADLPSTGGTVEADFEGAQTIAGDVFAGVTKPVHLVLHQGTFAFSNNTTLPANVTLELEQGALLAPAAGKTLTVKGSVQAGAQQKIVSGAGTVTLLGVQRIYPGWYGAAGDGATDDGPAIQAAINANPGRAIALVATAASVSGSGTASNVSYYSSQMLTLSGNGQILEGTNPNRWNAPVYIKFATGIAGIRIPYNCYGCAIRNLGLYGQAAWNPGDLTTFPAWLPSQLTGDGPDGIQVLGGEATIENVEVVGFGRHGIFLDGGSSIQSPSQVSFWRLSNITTDANRAYGIFPVGGDANAGLLDGLNSMANMLAGVYDYSQLGNVWIAPGSHNDSRDIIAAGSTQAVTSISVTSNVASITTTAANSFVLGTWVTTSGASDTSFNGTCKVTATGNPFTCAFTHADGSTTGGVAGTASSASVYAFLIGQTPGAYPPIVRGAYVGRASGSQVWINPYCELTSYVPSFGGAALVVGGMCASAETAWGHAGIRTDTNKNLIFDGASVGFHNHADQQYVLDIYPGATSTQVALLRWLTYNGIGGVQWSLGTLGGFSLKDDTNNFYPWSVSPGGVLDLASRGASAIRFQYGIGTGGVNFYGGGTTAVASINAAGKGTFNAGVAAGMETVTFSATPVFDCTKGNTHKITLSGNVTSSTLSGCTAGQAVHMIVCQDSTGNYTFTWPATMKGGMTVGSTASKCSAQEFIFDGSSAYATSSGVINQ